MAFSEKSPFHLKTNSKKTNKHGIMAKNKSKIRQRERARKKECSSFGQSDFPTCDQDQAQHGHCPLSKAFKDTIGVVSVLPGDQGNERGTYIPSLQTNCC